MSPQHCLTFLLLAIFCVREHATLRYQDLVDLGFNDCPTSGSCNRMTSQAGSNQFANCRCDKNCAKAGDCCVDARSPPGTSKLRSAFCADAGYFVTATCPSTFEGPQKTVQMCEEDDLSDPLLSAPVTDRTTNRTYLNRYCAQCRDASIDALTTWIIHVHCFHTNSQPNLTHMVYNRDLRSWGMQSRNEFHRCEIKFGKPASVNRLRACVPKMVSSCPQSYRRQTYRRNCESYTLAVHAGDKSYRNPHCAICHGFTPDQIKCLSADLVSRNKVFNLVGIMDVNMIGGHIVGVSVPGNCRAGQLFDMFFKKCRRTVCAVPGYVKRHNKCVAA